MMFGTWIWHPEDIRRPGPGPWSWFHILWLFIMIISTFLIVFFYARKRKYKYDVMIARIFGGILLVAEIIKVITFCNHYGYFRTEYLSLSICSMPMYVLIISAFINKEGNKFQLSCFRFVTIFGFIGGIGVMIMPGVTLNTPFVYYSIHTMLWHTILVIVSVYYFVSLDWKDFSIKNLIIPFSIFTAFTGIAIMINEIGYKYYIDTPIGRERHDILNYFFIASHNFKESPCPYPVLNIIKDKAPYPIFVISFLFLMFTIITIIYHLRVTITLVIDKYKRNKQVEFKKSVEEIDSL